MYLAADRLDPAYRALSEAVRVAAGSRAYRLLGETLLRLGDAQIAKPMLKRALAEGSSDPETKAWYDTAKAYIPMQELDGATEVARDVRRAMAERAAAQPRKVVVKSELVAAEPPSKRPGEGTAKPGASGAWRLGWLGSRIATADRPPPSTTPVPRSEVERSLPRFSIPGIPFSGRRAPDPVLPGFPRAPGEAAAKAPAEPRTRTDAPVTLHIADDDDDVDFDLDRDGVDPAELILETADPPAAKPTAPDPPPVIVTPPAAATKPAGLDPPRLVDERLWASDIAARRLLPPPPPPRRRARRLLRAAGLVALGLAAGLAIGRYSDRLRLPTAASPEPNAGRTATVAAPPKQAPASQPTTTAAPAERPTASATASAESPPVVSRPDALLVVTAVPGGQALTAVAAVAAGNQLVARRAAAVRPPAPARSARPTAPVPATTKKR